MTCEQIETELIPYLEGRGNAKLESQIEVHLAGCAMCHTRAEEYRRLWTVLDELPAIEPSAAFDARLRQRVAAEPRRWSWDWVLPGRAPAGAAQRWAWVLPAPRFALALLLLMGASVWLGHTPSDTNQIARNEDEFRMIKDLRVLEDYDVLSNFEALSELPPTQNQNETQVPLPDQSQSEPAGEGVM